MVQLMSWLDPAHPGVSTQGTDLLFCDMLQAHSPAFEGVLSEGLPQADARGSCKVCAAPLTQLPLSDLHTTSDQCYAVSVSAHKHSSVSRSWRLT